MNILLDTHYLLWSILGDDSLSKEASDMIMNSNNNIYYSILSLWEIEIKHLKRPMYMPIDAAMVEDSCTGAGFTLLPILVPHVLALSTLHRDENAKAHKDPFDRLLIAQAKTSDMIFLTHDELLPDYNEPCICFM
ncbi:MAG: type II toxin-antitoxin system VapC family toxin [Veillonella sp.]|nr:type II toxin-antitoxin system VapC family toxin [Veillonella sp.]MDU1416135.1 type II toxin-antitoxin system VapC family toxin [Veillonella sp.]